MKRFATIIIVLITCTTLASIVVIQHQTSGTINFSNTDADQTASAFNEISRGKINTILSEDAERNVHFSRYTVTAIVTILSGPKKEQQVTATYDDNLANESLQKIHPGDTVVLGTISTPDDTEYIIIDRYRLPTIAIVTVIFILLATIIAKWRGLTAIAGLVVSVVILLYFTAPQILAGKNPALIALTSAVAIAVISMYLAHGFKPRTTLAVISTVIALLIAALSANLSVTTSKLLGTGSSEAYYLEQGFAHGIDVRGLLLAGIIIGVLGVVNDITIAQAATVEEINHANPELTFTQLYQKSSSVGREHIASLINTLILTYAGASLPLFLLLTLNNNQPLWATLNSEMISEEIIRTLIGSIALTLSVPLTTAIASYYFHRTNQSNKTTK